MRQIVAGLTGDSDGTGDLAVELSKTDPASLETGQDSEDDSGEPEDWVPDPVDADPGQRWAALRGPGSLGDPVGLELWPPGVAACLELEEVLGPCPTWPGSPGGFPWPAGPTWAVAPSEP